MHATHMHSKQASSMVWYAAMAKGWASMGMRLVACMHACASWSVQEWSGRVGSLTGACMHACMGQHMSCHQCLRGMIWLHHNTRVLACVVSMLCPCMVHSLHSTQLHSTLVASWHACMHPHIHGLRQTLWLAGTTTGWGGEGAHVCVWVGVQHHTTPHACMLLAAWVVWVFGECAHTNTNPTTCMQMPLP